ncbi:hypothetical protein KEM09_09855 [Carboxylicivirga mesophila]|uniref:DUF4129 domain-containing protein n=1 Tax=Carboxylicivirga mesophila TaxID=1166478 RepID=A0ABS5K9M5_9BACT|nr:hypothetical protein [Carboxylicivirga mesophila]MBS2211708.1 hypothetical protein [Carboxylicivirga mesophila]
MNSLKYLIVIIVWSLGLNTSAQQDSIVSVAPVDAWDNSIVDYRCPAQDTIDYYRAQPEYQYSVNTDALNWWQKFVKWLLSLFRIGDGTLSLIGWLFLLLGVAAVVFIVIRLLGIPIKGLFIFSRSTKVTNLNFGLNNADIENEELENMLKVFINNQAYREATRILFLLSLRQLHRKNIIRWNAYKTDRDYYYEVDDPEIKSAFLSLIRQYEFIWFGKFNINEQEFSTVKNEFEQFMQLLTPNKQAS